MSERNDSVGLSGELLQVVRDLGSFRVDDVVDATMRGDRSEAATRRQRDEIERALEASPGVVELVPGKSGMWRVLSAAAVTAQTPVDSKAAKKLARRVTAALRAVESGTVLEPVRRKNALEVAEQRMRLAQSAARDLKDSGLQKRLASVQGRLDKLREKTASGRDPLLSHLADWTAALPQPTKESEASDFKFHGALQSAVRQAADPNAVYAPALAALANGLPDSPKRLKQVDELDHEIRSAALRGRVFDVLALGCLAAVTGVGSLADALVAAITTPAFATEVDHTGRRIAYTALANLARPANRDSNRAAAACAYLMRRARPGRDEMELLAVAALRAETTDPVAAFLLHCQWLNWERRRDSQSSIEDILGQFAHVARNLAYVLDSSGYEALKRALPSLANHELIELLVRHLADERNDALDFRSVEPEEQDDDEDGIAGDRAQFGAKPRGSVARLTDPARKRKYAPLAVPLETRMADFLEYLSDVQSHDVPSVFSNSIGKQAASRP